jgi:nucleoside-diphosphate-sugar epimerase
MRALVIGARGFLGTHVVTALQAAGTAVLRPDPPVDVARDGELELDQMLRRARPDVVVNAAGRTTGGQDELAIANSLLVSRLIDACCRTGVPRLVHLGSAAEYGAGGSGVPVSEDMPARPATPYGRTKLAGTDAVLRASRDGAIDGVVLRVFNPVGRGQPASTLLGRVLDQVRSVGASGTVVVGPLDASRDFVGAACVGSAVAAAVTAPGAAGRVVNIGSGRALVARDVVAELLRIAGHHGALVERGLGSRTSHGVDWQQADVALAATLLRWRPRGDLTPALTDAVAGISGSAAAS